MCVGQDWRVWQSDTVSRKDYLGVWQLMALSFTTWQVRWKSHQDDVPDGHYSSWLSPIDRCFTNHVILFVNTLANIWVLVIFSPGKYAVFVKLHMRVLLDETGIRWVRDSCLVQYDRQITILLRIWVAVTLPVMLPHNRVLGCDLWTGTE